MTPPKKQPIPFGKYLLLDRINIGGMAEVWRGKSFGAGGFERIVAIKRILPNIAEDEEFISMFIDEAKISAHLAHANIAQVHDLGQIGINYFIAMEYIPGKDMRAIFDRSRKKGEPAPVPMVCYVVGKLCEGLDYAHRKKDGLGRDMNIVHRDVSPQNLIISYEGEVKVIDFGIAKAAGKATKTQAGILKGKFGYMSPEQIRGLPLDRRSDIFAIGVCLYEMLTGERLFVGDSDFSVLEKVRKAEVLPPSTFNGRIPPGLEKIVLKALSREVEPRYQYASELAEDLQRFLITSDSLFSRKDLVQYMKTTFAEEVEREKVRLSEYADVKPPEGFLSAESSAAVPVVTPAPTPAPRKPTPPPSSNPVVIPPPSLRTTTPAPGTGAPESERAPSNPGVVPRRSGSLTSLPKLTPAGPMLSPSLSTRAGADDKATDGATMLVDPTALGQDRTAINREGAVAGTSTQLSTPSQHASTPTVEPTRVTAAPLLEEEPQTNAAEVPRTTEATAITPPEETPAASGAGLRSRHPTPYSSQSTQATQAALDETAEQSVTSESASRGSRGSQVSQGSRSVSSSFASLGRSSVNLPYLGAVPAWMPAVALGAVIFLVTVTYLLAREKHGYVYLDVSPDIARLVTVNINGEDVPVDKVAPTHVGKGFVLAKAPGYADSLQNINVVEGDTPTHVTVRLNRVGGGGKLVVSTDPDGAQISLDGKVVRAAGRSEFYIGEAALDVPHTLEASAAGYRTGTKHFQLKDGSEPFTVSIRLDPAEQVVRVRSHPQNASVYLGDRLLGTAPGALKVPSGPQSLTLKKRCYADAQVTVVGDDGSVIDVDLHRIPGCR